MAVERPVAGHAARETQTTEAQSHRAEQRSRAGVRRERPSRSAFGGRREAARANDVVRKREPMYSSGRLTFADDIARASRPALQAGPPNRQARQLSVSVTLWFKRFCGTPAHARESARRSHRVNER